MSIKLTIRKLLLSALFLRFILIFTQPHVDVLNHVDWGIKFWEYGPKNFYEQIFWGYSWPNQPPGSMLLFALVAKLYEIIFRFLWFLNLKISFFPSFIFPWVETHLHLFLLKVPGTLADLGMGFIVYKIVADLSKKEKLGLLASSLFLFNPALIYNSAVWGQTDSLINFLALLGLWCVWKDKYLSGWIFYLTSLYLKFSLIIFVPLFVLMLWQKRESWRKIVISLVAASILFLVISLPFVHHGNVFTWIWYVYTNRVLPRQGEMLSGNAFNLWTLFYGIDLSLNEKINIFGIAAKVWGELIVVSLSGLTTLMVIIRRRGLKFTDYLWLGVVYAFAAFLFLTNMHERYLYPVIPLMIILAVLEKKYLRICLALTGIYLTNLYNLWWHPRSEWLISFLTMGKYLLPRLLSLANIFLFCLIVKRVVSYEERKP